MRISDWSSDVCSSDLRQSGFPPPRLFWECPRRGHANGPVDFRPRLDFQGRGWPAEGHDGLCQVVRRFPLRCLAGHRGSPCAGFHLPAIPLSAGPGSFYERGQPVHDVRSEEHTSELQSLMRISYAVFCLKKKKTKTIQNNKHINIM